MLLDRKDSEKQIRSSVAANLVEDSKKVLIF